LNNSRFLHAPLDRHRRSSGLVGMTNVGGPYSSSRNGLDAAQPSFFCGERTGWRERGSRTPVWHAQFLPHWFVVPAGEGVMFLCLPRAYAPGYFRPPPFDSPSSLRFSGSLWAGSTGLAISRSAPPPRAMHFSRTRLRTGLHLPPLDRCGSIVCDSGGCLERLVIAERLQ